MTCNIGKYALLHPKCLPKVGSEEAAGLDLRHTMGEQFIKPGKEYFFNTGFACEVPKGWVGLVLPRSGMGRKYKLRLLNTCGVIDSDYRDWIQVCCTFEEEFWLEPYERICQMVVVPHYKVEKLLGKQVTLEELEETLRGKGGFGDSGRT